MGIYFGSNFNREPFQYDSVGNHWQQESVTRVSAVPLSSDGGGLRRGVGKREGNSTVCRTGNIACTLCTAQLSCEAGGVDDVFCNILRHAGAAVEGDDWQPGLSVD